MSDQSPVVAVRIVANDLAPRWRVGEIALIDPSAHLAVDDDVLVEFVDGRRTLRRLVAETDAAVTLATDGRAPTVIHDRREIALMQYVCGRARGSA